MVEHTQKNFHASIPVYIKNITTYHSSIEGHSPWEKFIQHAHNQSILISISRFSKNTVAMWFTILLIDNIIYKVDKSSCHFEETIITMSHNHLFHKFYIQFIAIA